MKRVQAHDRKSRRREAEQSMKRLQGKVAVVTGSSSGIGRAIATRFAQEGAKIVVSDVRATPREGGFEEEASLATADLIVKRGGEAVFVPCDVSSHDEVRALAEAAVASYGRLDLWVNNAAIRRFGKVAHEYSDDDLDQTLNVNVKGTYFGSVEAIKIFLSQGDGGNLINIVSTSGLRGHPRQALYNTSKGATRLLTMSLATDYGPQGIRVNGICPTFVKTSFTRSEFDDTDFQQSLAQGLPLGRWGEADDVAKAAVYLASDESSLVHGHLLNVDAGETLSRYI
ncbi:MULTISPECIES: SDR family NAD(P)-dependent oxidoreductase [Streptomyces]|uniref:SDR family NAD(P)-dependent oxidoreductase n=2 Tax=Streptomyces TaxID=1883 RepID=A0ABV9JBU9_9ACTN